MVRVTRDPSEASIQREFDELSVQALRSALSDLLVTIRDLHGHADPRDDKEADELVLAANHVFADACVELARLAERIADRRNAKAPAKADRPAVRAA